jgi:hypothetical protein
LEIFYRKKQLEKNWQYFTQKLPKNNHNMAAWSSGIADIKAIGSELESR